MENLLFGKQSKFIIYKFQEYCYALFVYLVLYLLRIFAGFLVVGLQNHLRKSTVRALWAHDYFVQFCFAQYLEINV
jgi:hypothetical protein